MTPFKWRSILVSWMTCTCGRRWCFILLLCHITSYCIMYHIVSCIILYHISYCIMYHIVSRIILYHISFCAYFTCILYHITSCCTSDVTSPHYICFLVQLSYCDSFCFYKQLFMLAHLSQKVRWAFAITWHQSSVIHCQLD